MAKETYLNVPLPPEIRRELCAQAAANARSVGREGALIITKSMRRRIARRETK
jgi:hypothetical protein